MSNTLVSGQLALPTLLKGEVKPLNCNISSTSGNMHEQSESVENKEDVKPNVGHLELLIPNKRKATSDQVYGNWDPQKTTSNKRSPVGSHAVSNSVSPTSSKRSMPNTSRTSASGKKVMHLESPASKTQSTATRKTAQQEVSPKGRPESYDSVRTKLRESLASALALVSQQRDDSSDGKTKTEHEVEANTQEGSKEHKPLVCNSNAGANKELVKSEDYDTSGILTYGSNDDMKASPGMHFKEACKEETHAWNYMDTDFHSNPILSGEDSLFGDGLFFKDELLQGNGLSWVSDPTPHISELNEVENVTKSEVMDEDVKEKTIRSPESLALEIEAELFKLFGGVNKKYKEKGRSLLFNLKDRNNPELRERVMAGEIPPDRLCSMTAEELASKELSEWRIAKAEELDHMKVLPESDVTARRLVKKTHKGEYQVDFEPDNVPSEELLPNISAPSQKRPKINGSDAATPKSEPTKVEQYGHCEITIPSDGTDMQGLMVDDMKDLPPIVSLDEFMESLNKEPPFENLAVNSGTNSGTTNIETEKENLDVGTNSRSPAEPSKPPVKEASQKTEEVRVESKVTNADKKLADSPKSLATPVRHSKQEHVWEGLLQLTLSTSATFVALYISGEKANTKEWADFFDIKGRVRLDAFDKFLQALPMSRTRAIMVSHFVLKEGSSDGEKSYLDELVESYKTDERLGFAEPAPGVELYLCPPRTKTVDMIINHLPKSYTEKLNNIDDGLIGIVVWRKVQITPSVISPNSSSHQKQTTTKNQTGGQNSVNDMKRNNTSSGFAPRSVPPPPVLSKPPQPDDDDDDVPPGFGPPGQREDDDLPEFNFSGGPPPGSNPKPTPGPGMGPRHHNLQAPTRQVDQMRELIQKYGQNGTNTGGGGRIPTEPWNDDDDDIPEWQPQAPHLGPPPQAQQPIQNPTLLPHMPHYPPVQRQPWANPLAQPIQPLQPPMNVQQQGTWWPYGVNNVGTLPNGQFNGTPGPVPGPGARPINRDWRSNNNKGF